jgi:RNA polymerase sigma factor (sigma-70 family)
MEEVIEMEKMKEMTEKAGGAPVRERRITKRDMTALMEAFAPLISSVARRYEGRGAEFDDLKQEGCLALLQIARRANKRQFLRTLSRTLPGRVRDAAKRMRGGSNTVSLYETTPGTEDTPLCETLPDPRAEERMESAELAATIERSLSAREYATAYALAEGRTYDEIAARTNATKQAVANRVRRIRQRLSALS